MELNRNIISEIIEHVPKRNHPKTGFTHAAVLMLFFNRDQQTHLIFIERTKGNTPHSGQIAFPGGKLEPEDMSSQAAAFRETQEEIGVSTKLYDYIGNIGFYETSVSRYDACAHVAWCHTQPSYSIDTREVACVFEIPVSVLKQQFMPKLDASDLGLSLSLAFKVYVENALLNIWGLTARITHHFLIGLHRHKKS